MKKINNQKYLVTLNEKGVFTIPKKFRDYAKLKSKDILIIAQHTDGTMRATKKVNN